MNTERIINEIEWLEMLFSLPDRRHPEVSEWRKAKKQNAAIARLEMLFSLPDERPLRPCDEEVERTKHEETCTDIPRFRPWRPDNL
jgi:hypothetical protein